MILHSLHSALFKPHVVVSSSELHSRIEKNMDILESIQQQAMKKTKGLKHRFHQERLREQGLLIPKEKVQGVTLMCTKGRCMCTQGLWREGAKRDRASHFSVMLKDRTRGSGHKLKYRIFHLNTRKHFYTMSGTEHWHKLLTVVVENILRNILKPSGQGSEQLVPSGTSRVEMLD